MGQSGPGSHIGCFLLWISPVTNPKWILSRKVVKIRFILVAKKFYEEKNLQKKFIENHFSFLLSLSIFTPWILFWYFLQIRIEMAPGWPIRGNCDLHGPSSCCCTNQLHLRRIPESCHWISPGIRFKISNYSAIIFVCIIPQFKRLSFLQHATLVGFIKWA